MAVYDVTAKKDILGKRGETTPVGRVPARRMKKGSRPAKVKKYRRYKRY